MALWFTQNHWKVSDESGRIWLMSWRRYSRSYAEKRLTWGKGKQDQFTSYSNTSLERRLWSGPGWLLYVTTMRMQLSDLTPLRALRNPLACSSWAMAPVGCPANDWAECLRQGSFLGDAEILWQVTLADGLSNSLAKLFLELFCGQNHLHPTFHLLFLFHLESDLRFILTVLSL